MREFEEAIRAHGLRPNGPVLPDGKIHKCKTDTHPHRRNGRYMLAIDGEFGWYQDWAADAETVIWRADGEGRDAAPRQVDYVAIRRRQRQERQDRLAAIHGARAFYDAADPLRGGHPYLGAKGLGMDGCVGLKVDREGWLVVPMMRGRSVVSVQRIAADGKKLFWKGAPTKGVSYAIEGRGASITVLAEGLATGLAIFAAAPLTRVVVAFSSQNLPVVAERLQWRGNVVVAGDNDHRTVCSPHKREGREDPFTPWEERPHWCRCNPGRCDSAEAARIIGCGVALPEGMDGTDWDDWRQETASRRRDVLPLTSHETEAQTQRAVDAELAMEVQRRMAFVVPKRKAC